MSPFRVAGLVLLGSGLLLGDAVLAPQACGQPPFPQAVDANAASPASAQQPEGSPAGGASDETTPKSGDAAEPATPAAAHVSGAENLPDQEWPRKGHYVGNMVRLLRPAKENFIAGFGEQAGSWTELALHDSEDKVYVPTVGVEVACFTTNERMIAFSGRTGTFDTLALRPGERATSIVGYAVACFSTNERCVAFSAETGRFDSVELKGEAAVPTIGMRTCTLFVGTVWYEFSARAGRWSGVDVGELIGPQQALPGHLGGPGGFGGGGFGGGGLGGAGVGGGGFFSVGPEGGATAASNGAGGVSNQTPVPFGGGGAVIDEAVEAPATQQPVNPLNARRFQGGGGAVIDEAVEAPATQQPANPLNARRFEGGGGAVEAEVEEAAPVSQMAPSPAPGAADNVADAATIDARIEAIEVQLELLNRKLSPLQVQLSLKKRERLEALIRARERRAAEGAAESVGSEPVFETTVDAGLEGSVGVLVISTLQAQIEDLRDERQRLSDEWSQLSARKVFLQQQRRNALLRAELSGSAPGASATPDMVAETAPEQPAWKPGFANRLGTQAGIVFLMADGRRLAGYSSRTGQWSQFEFRDHEVVTNATSGQSLVTIVTSQRLIGFSFDAGLFDAIDVPPEHAPIAPQNMIDYCWATIGSRVATFSAKTGRWTVLELGEHPQGDPADFLGLQ